MHSVSRNPGVIYKWSSLGTPKPRARLEEKEATEGWERGVKGRENEGENRPGGYRERARQRKGVKATEKGQRKGDRDRETEGESGRERMLKRERKRERETGTGRKISL